MDVTHLNKEQQVATKQIDGTVVVIAGAGSGKTRVLTHRIAYLMSQGIPSDNILAITFTNKAAEEMRERVKELVGSSTAWISTFHAMCVRILRRHITLLGYDQQFTIIDDDDQQKIIKKLIKDHQLNELPFTPRTILAMVSKMKYGVAYDLPPLTKSQIDTIFEEYVRYCVTHNILDFEDLLIKTVELFQKHPDVLFVYQMKFQYILVDEYQDTNDIQNKLIMMLGKEHGNIFLVGDEDQSIYRFRGANYKNLLNFEKKFPETLIIKLEQNYRSTKTILDAANKLIKHNKSKHKKNLWTENVDGDKLTYFRAITDGDEVLFIANEISTLILKGVKPTEIAILYRSNFMSRKIEESLRFMNIPYVIYGGVGYFKRKEVKDLIAYLNLVLNPNDNWSLARVINEPKRGIGPATIQKIADIAAQNGCSLFDIIADAEHHFAKTLSTKLKTFHELIVSFQKVLTEIPLVELIDYVIIQSGMQSVLLQEGDEGLFRLENLQEFKSILSNYQLYELEQRELLTVILDDLSLHLDHETAEQSAVKLMTMHNAKGLEFDYVFLYGLEENLFPNSRSMDTEEDIKEERRLAYVAVTRARKKVYLTNASIRTVYGQTNSNPPSRFLKEIGEDLLETKGTHKPNPKDQTIPTFTIPKTKVTSLNVDYALGEKVEHDTFGPGVVVATEREYVQIAFKAPHGIKRLMSGHPTIHKVTSEE